jgi:hypothetical protein
MPHAFVEKVNVPFAMPRGNAGQFALGPELPFKRSENQPDCALCGRSRDDRLHEASEQSADEERWPV